MKRSNSGVTLQQKFLPSSTPIPNWVIDDLTPEMPESVLRVFLYLFRKTVGWNNQKEEKSLTQLMDDCNIGRHTAVYAVKVLCDCWQLWKKTRGRKGQKSSVFEIAGVGDRDQAWARIILTSCIYGSYYPTRQQLKVLPPSEHLFQAALSKETAKYGQEWWVAKASQRFPQSTSGGSPVAPLEVSQ